ncbi:hypothetical protein CAEBREN_06285 [Caenorhabditis brenneri]|uniref:Uncharacterized protein n=1 Tax=Caenorhabditis brenneri TaxID=135651 RepID=G0MJU4_CAEBE|nr:hypothetical protein CAEBREN_06285 [Caenorhabditis brenneri]
MQGKKWTLIAFIVLLIGSWTAESRSRFEWLEASDPGEPKQDADLIADLEDPEDSEDFELRWDRFGRKIKIPRADADAKSSTAKVVPPPPATSEVPTTEASTNTTEATPAPTSPPTSPTPTVATSEATKVSVKRQRRARPPTTVAPPSPTPEAEPEPPVVGFTPDSLISEELSCQEPRSIELNDCDEACEAILGNLDVVDGPTLDPRWLLLSIILGFFALACLIRRARKWLCGEAQQVESTPLPDQTAQAEANIPNAPDAGKNPAKKEDKSLEEPSPPSVKNNAAVNKMRAKLLETQANLQKLRAHVKKTNAQHKSDTRTSKFQKKGPIFIPREPPIPPAAILPDNIVLEKVTYDPENNEMWDIGSDVDDVELDESFRLNPDSLTETEDEASQKSGSKTSKKNDPKDKKTGGTDDPNTPKENETPAPAPTAPPAPTTAPAPEPPKDTGKTADAKEKKENKSVEQDKSKKN